MRRVVLILTVCVLSLTAWADFAATPHLAGEFNGWDNGSTNPMVETASGSGIWTFTVTGQSPNTRQEFKVTDGSGTWDSAYPSANSWYYTDSSDEVTITFNTNIVSDGWLPEQYRLGTSTDPETWTLVGDFASWDNAAAAQAMTSLGDGIYTYSQTISAGTYGWKTTVTGSWDAIGTDNRSVNAGNVNLTLATESVVDFYVDALTGTVGIGDDIDLSFLSKPYAPDPADGKVVGSGLTALSWSNPDPNDPADTITCDVYFLDAGLVELTQDPNMGPDVTDPGVDKIAENITAETLDLNNALVTVLPLQDDHYYYWAVHATDPHADPNGNPLTTQGDPWYFFTGDAPPEPNQPVDQYMWLTQDDSAVPGGDGPSNLRYFEVTATYTDDDKSSIVDVNFVNENWDWANGELGIVEVSEDHNEATKTVTAVYRTIYEEGGDPNNTTVIPGLWNIRLDVTDGTGTVQGATGYHRIVETCGQAAFEDPTDLFNGYYDVNGDCIISLPDFAAFAEQWFNKGIKYE